MSTNRKISPIVSLLLAISIAGQPAMAQGKGGGKGHDKEAHGQAKPQGKGNEKHPGPARVEKQPGSSHIEKIATQQHGKSASAHEKVARPVRVEDVRAKDLEPHDKANKHPEKARFVYAAPVYAMPMSIREYVLSKKKSHIVAGGALAYAFARGHKNDFKIDERADHVRILNPGGYALVDLDDRRAEDIGRWRVGVLDDYVRDDAPSFCRSGEGHPVWGRQWCIDHGFGLGAYNDYRWGRTTDVNYINFPRTGITGTLTNAALATLLGNNTYDRLALHAVTLGLLEPLTGRWVSQPTGPQMLYVNSGRYPVAELVDTNRDFGLDDLIVALLPWSH